MAPHIVPPIPSKKVLESLKRVDLQRLCKEHGLRANLKSEALVAMLVDSRTPNIRSVQPVVRSVSTRRTSRAAPRVSSMIIHDEQEEEAGNEAGPSNQPETAEASTSQLAPRTRTSKAYATQTRLGVGRPVAAGGGGARAVTKSLSVSKKRGKASRSMNPKETTIVEEPEPEPEQPPAESSAHASSSRLSPPAPSPHPVSHTTSPQADPSSQDMAVAPAPPPPPSPNFDERIAEAIAPLQRQLQSMKADLEQMNALKAQVERLRTEVAVLGPLKDDVANLTAQLNTNRGHVGSSRQQLLGSAVDIDESQPDPTVVPTLLGKRPRESTGSDDSEGDNAEDPDAEPSTSRPERKRARLAESDFPKTPPNHPQSLPRHVQLGTPPPLDRLPELYGTTPPSERKRENGRMDHPYNFNFALPEPPTPNPAFAMPFAYPEPPQSPTPALPSTNRTRLLGPPRADIFQSIRLSSLERERQRQAESAAESSQGLGTFLNQAALGTDTDPTGTALLSEIEVGGNGSPSKRAMYGNEMETDNRFGDYGFESINPSFWAPS